MRDYKGGRPALWAVVLMLVVALAAPVFAAAPQGRGRGKGQDKKAAKFKNGHDARDGRWDGRGPRDDRGRNDDDDYDDDDYGRGRSGRRDRDRDRDRDNDGINDDTEIRRQAVSIGYDEGYRAGQSDRASGRDRDFNDHSAYRDATAGYQSSYGNRELYRRSFREGFRRGYEDGYRNRSTRTRGIGGVLGDIFGRP